MTEIGIEQLFQESDIRRTSDGTCPRKLNECNLGFSAGNIGLTEHSDIDSLITSILLYDDDM